VNSGSSGLNWQARELIPDARFEPFEESGHFLTIEELEWFNQMIRTSSRSRESSD